MKKNLLILVLLLSAAFSSQAQLSLTGEVRPRTELYNGNNTGLATKDDVPTVATQQRTRLYFDFTSESGLKLVFTPQLINFWGQMPQAYDLLGDSKPGAPEGTLSVYEAYALYKASDKYSLKVGRQAISYYDQRWFGALGWAASGRAHDAFVNKFTFGDLKLDVGLALNQATHSNDLDSATISTNVRGGYRSMQYAWLTYPAGDLTLRAMITNVTGASTALSNVTTLGILPTYKTGDLVLNFSAYYQANEANAGAGYLLAGDITYKGGSFPITVGADIVSGTSSENDGSNSWLQPFGTNHKFYGFMDFFYVGEGVRGDQGLTDIYAKAVLKTGEKTKLIVMPHVLKSTLTPEGILSDGYYGTELDLIFKYNVSEEFNFVLGYSKYFGTSLMETLYGGDKGAGNQWAWMQLTFKPKFL